MSLYRTNNIEALSERLESLKITNKALESNSKQIDKGMSVIPVTTNENIQAIMLKSIVLDSGWFNGDQTKFEDW